MSENNNLHAKWYKFRLFNSIGILNDFTQDNNLCISNFLFEQSVNRKMINCSILCYSVDNTSDHFAVGASMNILIR